MVGDLSSFLVCMHNSKEICHETKVYSSLTGDIAVYAHARDTVHEMGVAPEQHVNHTAWEA